MSLDLSKFQLNKPATTATALQPVPTAQLPQGQLSTTTVQPSLPTAQPTAPQPTVAQPATTTAAANPLAAKLAQLKSASAAAPQLVANQQLAQAQLQAAATKQAAEATALAAAAVDVPAEIYELNEQLLAIDGFPAQALQELLAQTYRAIEADQPDLPQLLEKISKNMRQYEELCYLLTDDQLALYFRGLMTFKRATIVATKTKTTKAKIDQDLKRAGGLGASLDSLDLGKLDLSGL